jgi:hypothetical protein
VGDNGVSLSTLATSSVVDDISDVLVDSERLSSHGRLIDGKKSNTRSVLLTFLLIFLILVMSVVGFVKFGKVGLVSVWIFVVANESAVGWDDTSVLNDDLSRVNFGFSH